MDGAVLRFFRNDLKWSFTWLASVPVREATLSSAGVLTAQTAAGCYCHISSTSQWTVSANACKEPINHNWGWHEEERCIGEGEREDMYSSNKQALSAPPRGSKQKSCFLLRADKQRLPGTLSSTRVNTKTHLHSYRFFSHVQFAIAHHVIMPMLCVSKSELYFSWCWLPFSLFWD